jgi:gentisate 1,2-dioxygenase
MNCSEKCNLTEYGDELYYEYTAAADIQMPPINPIEVLSTKNGINPIDLSEDLKLNYRSTTPATLVSFINLTKGQIVECEANASSNLFIMINGKVEIRDTVCSHVLIKLDCITFPNREKIFITAHENSTIYWVNDEPLLSFLGATPIAETFNTTHYHIETMKKLSKKYNSDPNAKLRNRNGILLTNKNCPVSKTLTPSLWSIYNICPANTTQPPHRHNSVALDLCLYANPNTHGKIYTLMSKDIDRNGQLIKPIKFIWSTGGSFITPPGWWHAHVNETDEEAIVFPVQDAGLQTYLRTLFIQFYT